jgi:hypothetical protein
MIAVRNVLLLGGALVLGACDSKLDLRPVPRNDFLYTASGRERMIESCRAQVRQKIGDAGFDRGQFLNSDAYGTAIYRLSATSGGTTRGFVCYGDAKGTVAIDER